MRLNYKDEDFSIQAASGKDVNPEYRGGDKARIPMTVVFDGTVSEDLPEIATDLFDSFLQVVGMGRPTPGPKMMVGIPASYIRFVTAVEEALDESHDSRASEGVTLNRLQIVLRRALDGVGAESMPDGGDFTAAHGDGE